MNPNERVEIEIFRCGRCGKDVETKWAYVATKDSLKLKACRGYLTDPAYFLAGEVFFHSECWDELIKEHPL